MLIQERSWVTARQTPFQGFSRFVQELYFPNDNPAQNMGTLVMWLKALAERVKAGETPEIGLVIGDAPVEVYYQAASGKLRVLTACGDLLAWQGDLLEYQSDSQARVVEMADALKDLKQVFVN